MSRHERLVQTIFRGRSDANIRFNDLPVLIGILDSRSESGAATTSSTRKASSKSSTYRAVADMPGPIR